MNNRQRKNKSSRGIGKLIGFLVAALFALPSEIAAMLIVLGIIGFSGYLVFKVLSKAAGAPRQQKSTSAGRNDDFFDDCPKPFCFHKDKGEHHLRKGKEIDPWDRPDIDIRKYQRRE